MPVARDSIATILNGDDFLRLLVPSCRHPPHRRDGRQPAAEDDRRRNSPRKAGGRPFVTSKDARGMSIASDNAARYAGM
jgi:hypothetical protein